MPAVSAALQIRIDDLRGPEIADLLRTHLAFCRAASPPESTHALDLDGLRAPAVTFWSAWEGPDLDRMRRAEGDRSGPRRDQVDAYGGDGIAAAASASPS